MTAGVTPKAGERTSEMIWDLTEIALRPGLAGQALGVGANRSTQRLGPAREVEQPDVARTEAARHRLGVTDRRQGADDHNPDETGQHTADRVFVLLDKGVRRSASVQGRLPRTTVDRPLFGSGFAGVGVSVRG